MTANDFLEGTASEILAEARRQRRARTILVVALVLLASLLAGMAVVVYVNARADQAQQATINQLREDLKRFCEDGVIDCRGHQGLPGPRGEVGTGISDIDCIEGRFVITFTNGKVDRIGDCVARDGKRGPRGFHGARGPRGHQGKPGRNGRTIVVHVGGGSHGHGHGHK